VSEGAQRKARLDSCRFLGLNLKVARKLRKRWEGLMSGRSWKLLQLTAACGVALGALTASAHAQSVGSWVMKAPLPASLSEVGVAMADGKVHVMGGSVLGFTGPYHQEYDPATDKWRTRSPVPRSLDHLGTAVLNGKIYVIGGFIGGSVHKDGQNTAFEYDPALDTWRILAPMKAGRGSVAVVALDGKLHAIGGRDPSGTTVATHEVYDPATNTWKELALVPKARDHMAAAVIDGNIHIAGGRFGASTDRTGMHDVYDPKANTWMPGPPLPTPRSGLAGTAYKNLFLVFGGEMPPSTTNPENEAYDAKTDKWLTLAPMPGGRHATGAVTDGNHVYIAGGSLTPGGAGATNQLIVFTLP
jgi:N-acetylneuraminic acid mutarotase